MINLTQIPLIHISNLLNILSLSSTKMVNVFITTTIAWWLGKALCNTSSEKIQTNRILIISMRSSDMAIFHTTREKGENIIFNDLSNIFIELYQMETSKHNNHTCCLNFFCNQIQLESIGIHTIQPRKFIEARQQPNRKNQKVNNKLKNANFLLSKHKPRFITIDSHRLSIQKIHTQRSSITKVYNEELDKNKSLMDFKTAQTTRSRQSQILKPMFKESYFKSKNKTTEIAKIVNICEQNIRNPEPTMPTIKKYSIRDSLSESNQRFNNIIYNLNSKQAQPKKQLHMRLAYTIDSNNFENSLSVVEYRNSGKIEYLQQKDQPFNQVNIQSFVFPQEVSSEKQSIRMLPVFDLNKHFNKGCYIGIGRFSTVYLVQDKQTGYILALKQILKKTINKNNLQVQLEREFMIHNSLKHINIIELYNVFIDDKKYYILMEVGECNLAKLIKLKTRIPETEAVQYLKDMMCGLKYLHQNRILHRDLKPQNIIFNNGICKIADFGWAVKFQDLRYSLCGTTDYASPEMLSMNHYSQKSDVWSLGIIAYEMLYGKLPFNTHYLESFKLEFDESVPVSQNLKNLIIDLLQVQQGQRTGVQEALNSPCFK